MRELFIDFERLLVGKAFDDGFDEADARQESAQPLLKDDAVGSSVHKSSRGLGER